MKRIRVKNTLELRVLAEAVYDAASRNNKKGPALKRIEEILTEEFVIVDEPAAPWSHEQQAS